MACSTRPQYRTRYAENLRRDLPRIPLAATREDYEAFRDAGQKLADLHLNYETAQEYPLASEQAPGEPLSWRVTKMRLSPDKTALWSIPTSRSAASRLETFAYKLGNRSALEWVVDQYQVKTDARQRHHVRPQPRRRPRIHRPPRPAGGWVSLETNKIVAGLPAD